MDNTTFESWITTTDGQRHLDALECVAWFNEDWARLAATFGWTRERLLDAMDAHLDSTKG